MSEILSDTPKTVRQKYPHKHWAKWHIFRFVGRRTHISPIRREKSCPTVRQMPKNGKNVNDYAGEFVGQILSDNVRHVRQIEGV